MSRLHVFIPDTMDAREFIQLSDLVERDVREEEAAKARGNMR